MKYIKIMVIFLMSIIFIVGIYVITRYQHTSSKRLENQYSHEIVNFNSSVDFDQDGIDDQTDILIHALSYIETMPKYKSKYYATGYPDDEYGTCTDVVANALKGAGYDLQKLVDLDIQDHASEYAIAIRDKNIDFRRVRNLILYFDHAAIKLTTDVMNIEEWHGGDVVIFQNHIGIVSDRRNIRGVPYVIHHSGPFQKQYEEDILEARSDIVGHYRMSE